MPLSSSSKIVAFCHEKNSPTEKASTFSLFAQKLLEGDNKNGDETPNAGNHKFLSSGRSLYCDMVSVSPVPVS